MDGKNSPSFRAALHTRVVATRITRVHKPGVTLTRQTLVPISAQTMRRRRARARSDITGQARKRTVRNARPSGNTPKVIVRKHIRLPESPGVQGLIPPREGPVEATLIAEHHMEGPQVVAVPDHELRVAVDVGHPHLMQAYEIFIPALGGWELSRGRLAH